MQASQIPGRFNIPFANSAVAPYIRPIPQASQVGITPGAASLTDGFPPDTFTPESSGGTPPAGQDFNGIFNAITKWIQWLNAGAPVFYNATFSTSIGGYPKGSLLANGLNNGTFWLSTVDNNSSNPDASGANWLQIVPASPATANPLIDGTAAPGTSLLFARQDHVHPSDTTRAALSYVNSTFETIVAAAATYLTINNPTSNGTFTHGGGNLFVVNGDIYASRTGATGAIFLGNTGTRYLYYDGTNYVMPGAELYVNGQAVKAGINSAQASANGAQASANAAQNTANTAVTNAANAQSRADTAYAQSVGSTFPFGGGYTDVTSSRGFNTVYTNTFGRVIAVCVEVISSSGSQTALAYVNGIRAANLTAVSSNARGTCTIIVPVGATYQINTPGNLSISVWLELH